jgi:hypothetical protein
MPRQDILSTLFDHWHKVADDTTCGLGEEMACLFVYLNDDAFDILGAIHDAYPEEERLCSLVYADCTGLLKELHWFHALFLSGNYPVVLSRLRFNWERIFRACHADAYAQKHPNETDVLGPTLEDKHNWLMQREDRPNWKTVIAPTLARLFTAGAPAGIEFHFKPLWDRLNRCVHPSGELREKLVGESALLARDASDEKWARETHAEATEVFALVWLTILSRFPGAVPALLTDQETFRACPQLRAVLGSAVGESNK